MTVAKLIEELQQMPQDVPVSIAIASFQGPDVISEITSGGYDEPDNTVYLNVDYAVDIPAGDRGSILGLPIESNLVGETCELCDAEHPEGGDGWDGLCPKCADRVSAMMDKHKLNRDQAVTLVSSTWK